MNLTILLGRIAKEIEIKQTQTGLSVAHMVLAVDRPKRKDAQDGQPTADFLNLTAFGNTAEFAQKYLSKGRQVLVQGRIQTSTYDAQDGTKRWRTDIIVDRLEFADSRPKNEGFVQKQTDDEDIPF